MTNGRGGATCRLRISSRVDCELLHIKVRSVGNHNGFGAGLSTPSPKNYLMCTEQLGSEASFRLTLPQGCDILCKVKTPVAKGFDSLFAARVRSKFAWRFSQCLKRCNRERHGWEFWISWSWLT